ncbi:SHOCT domain-containing protein [Nocardia mexicana]|uniref:Putative membrane protein n=1 Tax=Nocardia mexicana TaxID=279262 RepID=A0A370HDB8_9NOCA|nr:putative membrane protein [Nocardia mexicana]
MVWYGHEMSGWGYAWMGLGMVLFWGLLIAGFVVLVRYVAAADRGPRYRSENPGPEVLLAERFARGEIDEQEYASRLAALRDTGMRG